jgi:transposase
MPAAKYGVDLTEEERQQLLQFIRKGKPGARKVARANTLLLADEGHTDAQVALALHLGIATVGRVRKRFVEEGLEPALTERHRPGQRPKLTGKEEAHLIAVACSDPPEGHGRWTLRLLADKAVELGLTDSIARETVRQILKRGTLNPGRRSSGASRR